MKIVYIAHPIRGDVAANCERVRKILADIDRAEVMPIAPYLVTLSYSDEAGNRERGMAQNEEYFRKKFIDELWVYGISTGVLVEMNLALENQIPIHFKKVMA